jgi:predicted 2-oxoglutarate/Fe(II)-dependent dioxygenase YbiX
MNIAKESNLSDFIKIYNAEIPSDFCERIVASLNNVEWQKNTFYSAKDAIDSEPDVGGDLNSDMYLGQIPQHQEIMDTFWAVILKYITELHAEHYKQWNGFSAPRFNRYTEGQIMPKHCDHIQSVFDGARKGIPILSVLVALDGGYEGGELVMFDDHVVPMEAGSIVIFPSNFLYPHEVKPVTKGVRHTCVSWVW